MPFISGKACPLILGFRGVKCISSKLQPLLLFGKLKNPRSTILSFIIDNCSG
jgi:hypothetical protein